MTLDLLAIDTFSFTPHLETTGEICINESLEGSSVGFVFVHVDNPDDEHAHPLLKQLLGERKHRKVNNLRRLLSTQAVTQIDQPRLPDSSCRDAANFAKQSVATLDDLKGLSYKGAALGRGVASSLISRTGDSEPNLRAFRDLISRYLEASALVFEAAYLLIRQHRPKTVLVFNGRFACTLPIVEAAKQLQVGCLFHERGATFERYEIFDRPVDHIVYLRQCIRNAWDRASTDREELGRSFFYRSRNGDGIGWTSYTGGQERGLVPPRGASRRLVYFSSSDDEIAACGDLMEHPLFESQRHAVRFLIDWVGRQTDVELVIRVHPHVQEKSARERGWWDSLSGVNVRLESSAARTDSYALAESADAVLTYGSTMGVEASFLGKPVVLLGDSTYRGFGCVYEPETLDNLQALLARTALPPMPLETCIPYGYYHLTFGREYRRYQPSDLFHGLFMGADLVEEPELLRRLRVSYAGRAVKKIIKPYLFGY